MLVKELRHKYKVPSVLTLKKIISTFISLYPIREECRKKNNTLKQVLENIEIDLYFYKE